MLVVNIVLLLGIGSFLAVLIADSILMLSGDDFNKQDGVTFIGMLVAFLIVIVAILGTSAGSLDWLLYKW